MGSVYLLNTTTLEETHFFLSRNSARKSDNVHRLPPGSYRAIKNSVENFNQYQFEGIFTIENSEGNAEFVNTLPLSKYYTFNIKAPNFIIVGSEPPHGNEVLVALRKIVA